MQQLLTVSGFTASLTRSYQNLKIKKTNKYIEIESSLYDTISTIITNKLHESLKLLNLRPALCILMQKIIILNTT
jgi:hypothetical protein